MGYHTKDLTGLRFGKLTAIYPVRIVESVRKIYWICQCDCGNEKLVSAISLGRNTNSCGCIQSVPNYEEVIRNKIKENTKIDENGCWIWQKTKTVNGYAKIAWKEKCFCGHRISWKVFRGKIPSGLFVCHKCDVRECCNPDHLFLGTHTDNMKDMHQKGRSNPIDAKGRFLKRGK